MAFEAAVISLRKGKSMRVWLIIQRLHLLVISVLIFTLLFSGCVRAGTDNAMKERVLAQYGENRIITGEYDWQPLP